MTLRPAIDRARSAIVTGVADTVRTMRTEFSPSGLLLALVIASTGILALSSIVAYYFGNDVFGSLSYVAQDGRCPGNDVAAAGVGVHCFGDYYQVVEFTHLENPWANFRSNYSASGMVPNIFFGGIGDLFGDPRAGLLVFSIVLAAALITPAVWASRGKKAYQRLLTYGLFGVASIPALMAIDRGNNTSLAVPALLVFLVALRREKYNVVLFAIIAAALIRPQFVILIAVFMALRKWRLMVIGFASVGVSNALAYLFWPAHFPGTIIDSIVAVLRFGRQVAMSDNYPPNVSLGKGFYTIEAAVRAVFGDTSINPFTASYAGYIGTAFAVLVTLAVIILGKRIPAHIGAILVLMACSMFPSATFSYYLVFALPVAAILLRDPLDTELDPVRWHGVLDDERSSRSRIVAAVLITVAVAGSLTRLLMPYTFEINVVENPVRNDIIGTTAALTPVLWIAAAIATLIAWGLPRRERNASAASG